MEWIKVQNSSSISEYSYAPSAAPEDGGTLGVRFHSGGEYHYYAVPAAHFDAMQTAESVGKYYASHIRGKYTGIRIET